MIVEKIQALSKNKFYIFRVKEDITQNDYDTLRRSLAEEGLKGLVIRGNSLDVVKVNKKTYKLVEYYNPLNEFK